MPGRDYEYNQKPIVTLSTYRMLLAKHDATTELLCMATTLMENVGFLHTAGCPKELRNWHIKHKKDDETELRRTGLEKLTQQEKAALGLL